MSEISDVMKSIINFVAAKTPTLASALNPAMSISSLVLNLIANIFGGDVKKPEDLLVKMQNDPEALLKLRQLEEDHFKTLVAHENEIMRQEILDRMSARKTQTITRDWIVHFLACAWTLGLFLYVVLTQMFPNVFKDNIFHELLNAAFLILSFYFGKSYAGHGEK